ncbi:MAG: sugar ABC transporter permease [Ignavibacteriaceae bacterium]|nr:sugar ABC transporter permease [Ignavibacteriaceae bacterium]
MRTKEAYLFLAPAMVIFGVFLFYPMGKIIYYSFYDYNLLTPAQYSGLDNYLQLFSDEKFLACLGNSFIFILVSPLLVVVSLMLALAVRDGGRGAKFLRLGYFLPVITPVVIAGIIWRWIYSEDTGILNYLLSTIGISPVAWLSEYPTNIVSVMILTVWRGFGYYMMIFLAGLAVIPAELEEAAKIDGAGRFQRVRMILIPLLLPSILFIMVISTASAVRIFTEQYILLPGVPMDNKAVVSFLFNEAFEQFRFGYASAAGVVLFIVTLGISWLNIKMLERPE